MLKKKTEIGYSVRSIERLLNYKHRTRIRMNETESKNNIMQIDMDVNIF